MLLPCSDPPAREELWICNLDGSALRRVGSIPLTPHYYPTFVEYSYPGGLQWAPEGKRVSFTYQPTYNAPLSLYIVLVE